MRYVLLSDLHYYHFAICLCSKVVVASNMDRRLLAWRVTTLLICAVGLIGNSVSLSYFSRGNNSRGLGNKLLALLNFCDLIVCISAITSSIFNYFNTDGALGYVAYLVSTFVYVVFFDLTGFSTCLLSVVRMIKVWRPFFVINEKGVAASFLFYLLFTVFKFFVCYYLLFIQPLTKPELLNFKVYTPAITSIGTAASLVAVFLSAIVTVHLLRQKSKARESGRISRGSKHATITVLILSTVFCAMNLIFVIASVLTSCFRANLIDVSESTMFNTWELGGSLTATVNSVANPFVYILRKNEMRRFVTEILEKVKRCLGVNGKKADTVVSSLKKTERSENAPASKVTSSQVTFVS